MELSQFSSALQSSALTSANGTTSVNNIKAQTPPPPPPSQDELSDFMAESGGDDEVKAFMQSIMDMEASGEFDAQSLASTAPASMQAFAEENNIDLKSFFQQKHDQQTTGSSPKPGQSPMAAGNNQTQAYANNQQLGSASSSLMEKLTSSVGVNTLA